MVLQNNQYQILAHCAQLEVILTVQTQQIALVVQVVHTQNFLAAQLVWLVQLVQHSSLWECLLALHAAQGNIQI